MNNYFLKWGITILLRNDCNNYFSIDVIISNINIVGENAQNNM